MLNSEMFESSFNRVDPLRPFCELEYISVTDVTSDIGNVTSDIGNVTWNHLNCATSFVRLLQFFHFVSILSCFRKPTATAWSEHIILRTFRDLAFDSLSDIQ